MNQIKIALFCLGLLFFFVVVFSAQGSAQGDRIKIIVSSEDRTGKFADLNKWFSEALVNTGRYIIVKELKEAEYVFESKLSVAEETIINQLPASDVTFTVAVRQTDSVKVYANVLIARQSLINVKLEQAVKDAVKDAAESLKGFRLRFNFSPQKKA